MRRLCVFCGSSVGARPAYAASARQVAAALAGRGIGLVYGGGGIGLMGVLADAVLAARGEAIGVIPRALATREIAHQGLTQLRIVGSMHERKALMAGLADAFLVLPGGMGTLDELCEILTWAQLGLHAKPVGLVDVRGYWRPFLAFLDAAVVEGFVREGDRAKLRCTGDAGTLVDALLAAPVERA